MGTSDRRREVNRASYQRSKASREATLLRLDKGDLARLDAACALAGLSRSAFAKLHLLPMADAMAPRLRAIESARAAERLGLASFLARALDDALAQSAKRAAAPIASEFDALFASPPAEEPPCSPS